MDALNKQLDTLKTIVPEEKETDEFIRLLQGAASASNVDLRRLKALTVSSSSSNVNYYEMPFEVQADGPYFKILDFFGRVSRLARVIQLGDLRVKDNATAKGTKDPHRAGQKGAGDVTATTYVTKPADAVPSEPAAK